MARKTGSSSLDAKLALAERSNDPKGKGGGSARRVLLTYGGELPEGKRVGFLNDDNLGMNKAEQKRVRSANKLTGVVTDRRGSVEVPGVNIPGIEKKAKRVAPKKGR